MNFDTLSQQTRATGGSISSDDTYVFDLPQASYRPLKIGVLSRKTKLEDLLEKINLKHEDYIWYTEVLKVSTKTRDNKDYYIILSTNLFYMLRISDGKVKSYTYQDVESIRHWNTPQTQHGFKLRFYRKDGNLKNPQKEMTFTCKNSESYFSVTHVIERQMPLNWQLFFEAKIEIQSDDCYQFHAYLLKENRFGQAQPRFIILT